MKKVALIGAGHVNWHIGHSLPKRYFEVCHVYSRTKKSASTLAKSLSCKSTTSLKRINKAADIIIIAVNDDALAEVAEKLSYLNSDKRVFIHTSGSAPLSILEQHFTHCGIFWPPQSIRKENKIKINNTPFVIVSNKRSQEQVRNFAARMTKHVHELTEEQKATLHLAAVLANNFTTHLLGLAYQQCKAHRIDFSLLKPIIMETADRITGEDPSDLQTGPAIRGDQKTIDRHLKLLKKNKELKKIYSLLSKSINPKLK